MDAPKRRRKGKIHAMPPEVRARIDDLLRADRHTFAEIKAIMAAEFPEEEPLSTYRENAGTGNPRQNPCGQVWQE